MYTTNAQCNRSAAMRCFKAGATAQQIAAQWPRIWTVNAEGQIGQRYDARYTARLRSQGLIGEGIKETRLTMAGVDEFIATLAR